MLLSFKHRLQQLISRIVQQIQAQSLFSSVFRASARITHLPRIALLIDGENYPAAQANVALEIARRQGHLVVQRVYANWSRPANQAWIEPVARYGLQPVHHERVATNKNATDILLVVEAMDLLYGEQIDRFCLVTGDSDYVPLVKRLRKAGKEVIVIGGEHTTEALRDACSRFISFAEARQNTGFAPPSPPPISGVTDTAGDTAKPDPLPAHAAGGQATAAINTLPALPSAATGNEQVTPDNTHAANPPPGTRETVTTTNGATRPLYDAVPLLARAMEQITRRDSEGWVSVAVVGQEIRKLDPTFRPNHFGHASLSKLVLAISSSVQIFETRLQSSGQLEVRFRPTVRQQSSR
jgi:uncharacterized protein (TIGR00288 family)